MTDELPVAPLSELTRRRSAKWRKYPAGVLPLHVAEMDFALAPPVLAALREAVDASDVGYSHAEPELGEAYAGFAADRWGWQVDPAAVTAITDVGVGVVELLRVFTRPGDMVAISPPVYPPFFDWNPEAGVRTFEVPLHRDETGYRLDLAAIETAFALHPAVYVLSNPHNPVGRVHTAEELTALVRLAARYRVTLVSDEIHAPLVLPGAAYTPILSLPGAADVAVAVVSASKAFNLAGLKCAAVVTASARMAAAVEDFPPDSRWRTGHLGVIASIAAFRHGGPWLDQLLHTLDARRTQLGRLLRDRLPAVSWHPPQATYLAWLDCHKLADDPQPFFLDRAKVALEDGLHFGAAGAGHVRLNYGTGAHVLDEATARLAAALSG
ncbi:aminotransferase class I/II-fold pyridoxal phosphate-dependent enzyme [Actinoplanes sp. NBRC 103695]|uniref:MalY/PatB family protein n=1 Tax=Actinoplanes sp. NBRC 103695 TaxID=3032202 RepID=UPI0024A540AC|nr:aminotransferase class I/II-fold pyridoxal phosphate-dependent enzyme [Actinoplanes sp. NBRC 103695]GLY93689.1 cystathionine beta-lyase [Actinoplanes sp. NBRC 103695]